MTKAGVLNVPEWYEAGQKYLEQPGAIGFGGCASVCAGSAWHPRHRLVSTSSSCLLLSICHVCSSTRAELQASPAPFHSLAGPLVVSMHYMYGFVEYKRYQDFMKPGSQAEKGSFVGLETAFAGVETSYPGGAFDPLGLSR
jgi:hypothetical protein